MAILTNIDDLLEDVRSLIDETTADFWSDAFIERQLEKAHQIISTKVGIVHTIWTATLTSSTPNAGEAQISNDREIRLPSTFISIDHGGVYYNDRTVLNMNIDEISRANEEWLDESGDPGYYYLRGDMLGFDRKIAAGDTVRIYGVKMPTALSSVQEPFDGDYRTIGYRSLLVDYAVGMCWRKKNEMTKYREILQPGVGSFWQGIEDMRCELIANNADSYAGIVAGSHPGKFVGEFFFPDLKQLDRSLSG